MCGAVRPIECTIFYFVRTYFSLVGFNIFLLIVMLEAKISHRHGNTEVTIFLDFLTPLRIIVTTGWLSLIGITRL